MKLLKIGITIALLLTTQSAHALVSQEAEEYCKDLHNITIDDRVINDVYELQHDPKLYLLRRCMNNKRKKLIGEQQVARQLARETAHFNRSSKKGDVFLERSERVINRAIRRKNIDWQKYHPDQVSNVDINVLRSLRSSRRQVIREKEGQDRLHYEERWKRRTSRESICKGLKVYSYNANCPIK